MTNPRLLILAILLVPLPALATELEAMSCKMQKLCVVGAPCVEADEVFSLEPIPGGYGATIDSGWIELKQVSPPEAEVKAFFLSGPRSISVLVSLFQNGDLALTLHEDIEGRYVETSYAHCVLETM